MPPRRRYVPRPPDLSALAEAMARPGADPRQWVSMGTVDDDEISFDPELGPLVPVTLQPSQVQVFCRVASSVAGDGEAEYTPFVAGDEVIVAIPGGNERGGSCVILGRLNNERAPFPIGPIAGQDPTTNSFSFQRSRTPKVTEYEGPWIVRQASSGALLSLDTAGAVTIRDGAGDALQMTADVLAYQSADATALLQLDVTGGRFTLQVGDALLTLSKGGASPEVNALAVPGAFALSTNTNPAAEHVLTTEAACSLIAHMFNVLGAALVLGGATPLTSAALGALFVDPAFAATLAAAVTAAAAGPPSGYSLTVAPALYGAFTGSTQKPAGVPGVGQLKPGIGCPGLLAG